MTDMNIMEVLLNRKEKYMISTSTYNYMTRKQNRFAPKLGQTCFVRSSNFLNQLMLPSHYQSKVRTES